MEWSERNKVVLKNFPDYLELDDTLTYFKDSGFNIEEIMAKLSEEHRPKLLEYKNRKKGSYLLLHNIKNELMEHVLSQLETITLQIEDNELEVYTEKLAYSAIEFIINPDLYFDFISYKNKKFSEFKSKLPVV